MILVCVAYKVLCLTQVTIGVRGNVVSLSKPFQLPTRGESGLHRRTSHVYNCSMESFGTSSWKCGFKVLWAQGCYSESSWREFWCYYNPLFVVFHVFYKLSMQVNLICSLSKLTIHTCTLCARGWSAYTCTCVHVYVCLVIIIIM